MVLAAGAGRNLEYSIAEVPASPRERRCATSAVLVSTAVFLVLAPFAKTQLPPIFAFIPIYQSALIVGDFVTATLLFGHFLHSRSLRPFLLASGYTFTAFMAAAHMLTFPGLFAPTGLLGAGPQSTAWLYMAWHAGFPLYVMAYARTSAAESRRSTQKAKTLVATSLVFNFAAVLGLLSLATSGQGLLPPIMDGNGYTPAMTFVISSVWAFSVIALVALWRSKSRTVLDVWLMVAMSAWMFDIALSALLNAGRFDLGFYSGRIYGLLTAIFVLAALLVENSVLYAKVHTVAATMSEKYAISERTFATFMERGPFVAGICEPTGKVLYANRMMAGLDKGDQVALMKPSLSALESTDETLITLEEGAQPSSTWHMLRFPVEVENRQRVIGVLGIDLTAQKAAEKAREIAQVQLQESYKLASLGEMAGGIAHEINNPVAIIIGKCQQFKELVDEGSLDHKFMANVCTAINNTAHRILRIVNGLRTISRAGVKDPFQPVSVGELVDGTMAICAARFRHGNVELSVSPVPQDLVLECRANEISQILVNLLGNAYDAAEGGENPLVELTVHAGEDAVTFAVKDSGPGVPPEIRKKIMLPFFTTKEVGKGTGLGLSISQSLAHGHGGSVSLDESAPTTCFVLRLPRGPA